MIDRQSLGGAVQTNRSTQRWIWRVAAYQPKYLTEAVEASHGDSSLFWTSVVWVTQPLRSINSKVFPEEKKNYARKGFALFPEDRLCLIKPANRMKDSFTPPVSPPVLFIRPRQLYVCISDVKSELLSWEINRGKHHRRSIQSCYPSQRQAAN